MNARNNSHLCQNIRFASYGFSTICYFRMIAVFESFMRVLQSGWARLLNYFKDKLLFYLFAVFSGKIVFYTHPPEQHTLPTHLSADIVSQWSKEFDLVRLSFD